MESQLLPIGALVAAIAAIIASWLTYKASRKNNEETLKGSPYQALAERIVILEGADQKKELELREQRRAFADLTSEQDTLLRYIRDLHIGLQTGAVPPLPPLPSYLPLNLRLYLVGEGAVSADLETSETSAEPPPAHDGPDPEVFG